MTKFLILFLLLLSSCVPAVSREQTVLDRYETCRIISRGSGTQLGFKVFWCIDQPPDFDWVEARSVASRVFTSQLLDQVDLWITPTNPNIENWGYYSGWTSTPSIFIYTKGPFPMTVEYRGHVLCHELAHAYEHLILKVSKYDYKAAFTNQSHFVYPYFVMPLYNRCLTALQEIQ